MAVSETKGRRTVDSLVQAIDEYIAEQEDFRRPQPARSDSRGTMFIDTLPNGDMKISYRNDPNKHSEDTHHHLGERVATTSLTRSHERVLPDEDLYTIDRRPGESVAYAPPEVKAKDGTVFVRVRINSAGCGIYAKQQRRPTHLSSPPLPPLAPISLPLKNNIFNPPVVPVQQQGRTPQRPLPGAGLSAEYYHDDKATGASNFQQPRSMRQFEPPTERPLPRGSRRAARERRNRRRQDRRDFVDMIKALVRRMSGGNGKARRKHRSKPVVSTQDFQ